MRFVISGIGVDWRDLPALARAGEELGYDGLALGDHVAMPARISSRTPYTRRGDVPMDVTTAWPDPWVMIGAMAVSTTRLRFVTSVYLLPLRHPLQVAKAVGTAAALSGGRVVLGVGVGWLEEEFAALGTDFASRGARADEAIAVLRRLSSGGPVANEGPWYPFPEVSVLPAPPAPLPVYVGGESPAALRRCARVGDGYLSAVHRADTLVELTRHLTRLRAEEGTAGRPFEVVAACSDAGRVEDFAALEANGIHSALVAPWKQLRAHGDPPLGAKIEALGEFARTVVDRLG